MTKIDPIQCPVFPHSQRICHCLPEYTFPNPTRASHAPLPSIRPLVLPSGNPFPVQPAVEKVQAGFGLVQGDHVPGRMDPHKREVAATFHLADFPSMATESEGSDVDLVISFFSGPIERFRPGIISQPIAYKVSVTLHSVSTRIVISYCLP